MKEDELAPSQKEVMDEVFEQYMIAFQKNGFDEVIKLFMYEVSVYYALLLGGSGESSEVCKNLVHQAVDVALDRE